jgi:tryptophan synthase alpha chain
MERFLERCAQVGVDGLILPDLPLENYLEEYRPLFER